MSTHCGYVVNVKELRPHSNADKLQIATFFGNDTCVGLDVKLDDIGIYFPSDLQLSIEYCEYNNLLRKKDEAGNNIGGYLDPDKRNINAIKLRGERSDGIFLPLNTLAYTGVDLDTLTIGTKITEVNGHMICQKYIPRTNKSNRGNTSKVNKTRKKSVPIAPLFTEHADTEQLAYNLDAFKPGDYVEITLKMHGTSQRTGYVPVFKGYNDTPTASIIDSILKAYHKIIRKPHETYHDGEAIYEWGYISGTRRTVLENYDGGYYGSNEFREQHSKFFEGKLLKGEEVYYEVVGFTHTGAPIMGDADNKKLNDKEFVKQYGKTTTFSYGCSPIGKVFFPNVEYFKGNIEAGIVAERDVPQNDIYVYRMTMTNEDGDIVEYTPDYMRYRCEQMGAKCVPLMWAGIIPENIPVIGDNDKMGAPNLKNIDAGEYIKFKAEQYYDGPDPIGKTHVREGVVVRIVNRPKFCAFKHKNWSFKALEGIVKVNADTPHMEEAQENEENA